MRAVLLLLSLLSVTLYAQVISPPSITEPISASTRYVSADSTVVLKCKATGKPEPAYKWLKDGKVVQAEKDEISFDSRSGDLTIKYYNMRYDGDYVCIATIQDAASMSQTQRLVETRLTKFKDPSEPVPQMNVNEYSYVSMECKDKGRIVGAPNDISYNWYLTDKSKEVKMDNGRLFIDNDGGLHFTYVKREDESTTDTKYLCGYSSVSLKVIYMGNNIAMSVTKNDNPTARAPINMYYSKAATGTVGSSARLECFFAGYDPSTADHLPTIKWFDNEKEIVNSDKYQLSNQNRVLTISNLIEQDDKNFFCQGFTTSGNSKRQEIHLNVTSPPIWKEAPETQTKSEKQNAVFHCNAKSLPYELPPQIPEWFFNGKPADSSLDFNRYIFSTDKKMLTIKRLKKPEDIQCIQCKVSNSEGTIMGDACLNVLEPIDVLVQPPLRQEIDKGDDVLLTVKARTDKFIGTGLRYEWTFNGEKYIEPKLPPFANRDEDLDKVFINTSSLTREDYEKTGGTYTCRIFHLYDEVTVSTEVTLKGAVVPVVASAGFDMWIIGLIIGILFLVIVITIIIFVICRKKQEGDYNVDKKETGAGHDPEKELREKGFNDLSRPDYDDYDYPEKKPRGELEYDDVPIGDEDSMGEEYGDEEDTHFNEDGSFIGIYQKKENERNHKAESTI